MGGELHVVGFARFVAFKNTFVAVNDKVCEQRKIGNTKVEKIKI